MNKIERAIEDVKMEITRMQKVKIATEARLEAYLETLDSLESIERDKHIPHADGIVAVDNTIILKARWEHWDKVKNSGMYEGDSDESAYTDGFTHGAKWMQQTEKQ
jgi:hypothetical protein